MAIVKCPECGKDVSDKADACLNCGYNVAKHFLDIEKEERERLARQGEERLKNEDFERRMSNVKMPKRNKGLWIFAVALYMALGALIFFFGLIAQENQKLEEILEMFLGCALVFFVFPMFLYIRANKKYEKAYEDIEAYKRKQVELQIKKEELQERNRAVAESYGQKAKANTLKCRACGSENVSVVFQAVETKSKVKSEVKKKNAISRAGNKAGRAGMILATGGLWAVTPKKSDYKEVQKGKTKVTQTKTAVCQNCGKSWVVW